MAQYQHLPIYKATYELLRLVTHATSNFPKAYKYSLGDKLRAEVVEMVVFIFKANSSRGADRAAQAALFLERLQVVELMVRLSKDLRLLTVTTATPASPARARIALLRAWSTSREASPATMCSAGTC